MNHSNQNYPRPLAAFLFLITAQILTAQTPFVGEFNLTGSGNNIAEFSYNGTPITNLEVNALTKNGITTSSSTGNFRGSNWPTGATNGSNDFVGSLDPSKYIEFGLTASDGFFVNLSSITFGIGRSSTGPRQWEWRSSVDSFAAPITTYSSINLGLTESGGVLTNPDENSNWTGNILSLIDPMFQGLPSISFRLYGFNAEATGGTGGLQGNLSFAGSTVSSAPTTTVTWTGTGAGETWAVGATGHFAAPYSNNATSTAEFAGVGEVVTVSGGVQTGKLSFVSSNYTVTGSEIELAEGILTAATGVDAEIASSISGSSGLTKLGAGQVKLSGNNTFEGLVILGNGILEVSDDQHFGMADNDISFSGGTLLLGSSIELNSGREMSGTAVLNIPTGMTLGLLGSVNNTSTQLLGEGILSLQGGLPSLGTITFENPAIIQSVDPMSVGGVNAASLIGQATLEGPISLPTGDRTFNVGPFASLIVENSIVSGGRIIKSGAGTMDLKAENTGLLGVRVGLAGGATGGQVRIFTDLSLGTSDFQFNHGSLHFMGDRTIANNFSIGGRNSAPVSLEGDAATLTGNFSFFLSANQTMRMNVNNNTVLDGPVSGAIGNGFVIGGNGQLTVNSDSSGISLATTITEALTLVMNGIWGSSLTIEEEALLAGVGIINGQLSGNGTVKPGPVASTGILTANSIDPSLGLDFDFGLSTIGPIDLSDPLTSPNALLRLTATTSPIVGQLDLNNTIRLFIAAETLVETSAYLGGFFTEMDSLESIDGANFEYYVLGDGFGLAATYNGDGYYSLAQFNTLQSTNWNFTVGSLALTGVDFTGEGDPLVDGSITTFTVVPEPGTWLLFGLGAIVVILRARRFR